MSSEAERALLSWEAYGKEPLRSYGDFIVTPYVAIRTRTRRKTEPLTEEQEQRMESWARRGRRGIVVRVTKKLTPYPIGLVLRPKTFGYVFSLDQRIVKWLDEQPTTTLRLISSRPRNRFQFVVVAFQGKVMVACFGPQRRPVTE